MSEEVDCSALLALPDVPTRAQIFAAEAFLASLPSIKDELTTVHNFAPGLYSRELHIPAGTFLTGRTHKTEHLNVLEMGDITVWTEEGMKRISAPFKYVSKPGTKRIGYTHTDTVWTTYHVTQETDLDKIEAEVVEPTEDVLLRASQVNQIEGVVL